MAKQLTPQQAITRGSVAAPPHEEKASHSGIEFEQAAAGLRQAMMSWVRVEAGYDLVAQMMEGTNPGCIMAMPTGGRDAEGNQVIFEIDLEDLFRGFTEEGRQAWLTPIYNYLVERYGKCLKQIEGYTKIMRQQMGAPTPPPPTPEAP